MVNFDSLDTLASCWRVDAAISALGTTTGNTPSKVAYEKVETGYPEAVARLVRDQGAKAFAYVSTMGLRRISAGFTCESKVRLNSACKRWAFLL